MVWSIFRYENSFITVTREEINGIPCLKFRPKGYEGLLPTVICYHGWHSSKDFKRFEAMIIASHGYQVIAPDAIYHGDRDPIDHDDPKNLERYLWEIVLQNVRESKKLIELIVRDHEADPARLAVMGDSMGAISAGGIFVDNAGLKCLISSNGALPWQAAIKRGFLPPAPKADEELIKRCDPMENPDRIKDRSILILHGTQDTSLPIECQRLFFDAMLPLYGSHRDKLEFVEDTNVDHRTTTGMLERAVIWLKEKL